MRRMMRLDRLLAIWIDGDEHGWGVEFAWLEENHPERLAALAASIEAEGMREPILLGTDGRVWDGHHRLWVAAWLGMTHVPVQDADESVYSYPA